jgi:hypothetical protein
MGIASREQMKARTLAIARGGHTRARRMRNAALAAVLEYLSG